MAIFERSSNNKIRIDDTERLTCSLENAQNINKHTVSSFINYDMLVKGIHVICIVSSIYRSIFYGCKEALIKRINGRYLDGTGTSPLYTSAFSRLTLTFLFPLRNLLEICNHLLLQNDKQLYRYELIIFIFFELNKKAEVEYIRIFTRIFT